MLLNQKALRIFKIILGTSLLTAHTQNQTLSLLCMFLITYWFFFNHQAQITITGTSAKSIQ